MQVLAVEKAAKNKAENEFTRIFRDVQKLELVNGLNKKYSPREEGGEKFPDEKKLVVVRVEDELKKLQSALVELFDLTATKDNTNCKARADVVLPDGTVLLKEVPATQLLFIEKKLVDLVNFARKLPTLDPADTWSFDAAQNLWSSEPTRTVKTKKVVKHDVIVPPTKEHPAQIKEFTDDVIIGDWTSVKQSGALQYNRVQEIISRAETLARAVKEAREEANTQTVEPLNTGAAVLGFIFGK